MKIDSYWLAVAVLEICAAGAANQQRIAGEDAVGHHEGVGVVGVPGRVDDIEADAFDFDPVAVGHAHRDDVGLGLLAHHGDAARAVAQRAEPGDVVGVEMGVDGLDQAQIELIEELDVAIDLFQHRIDDQRLAPRPTRDEIAVGARWLSKSWRKIINLLFDARKA